MDIAASLPPTMKPGISVIMATYNGSGYLEQQLDSIKEQSLTPAEIIVSDDNSSDATIEILSAFAARGEITFLKNESRAGIIGNFKRAAAAADPGNFVAFSDQDDLWLPQKLAVSLDCLFDHPDQKQPVLVYSDPEVINANGISVAPSLWSILGFNNYTHTLETVLFGNPAGGCTMLLNPALAGYIPSMPEDCYMHDAWITLCAFTFGKAIIAPGPLLQYRQHATNVTFSNAYKRETRLERILKEVKKAISGNDDLFKPQFRFVRQFYEFFKETIPLEKKIVFESFLGLENRSYLIKKFAFRRAARSQFNLSS